jgi:hypothetical protein
MVQFLEDNVGDENLLEDPWKDLNMATENGVVDGVGIANNQPRGYKPIFRSVACSCSKCSMLYVS